MKCKVLLRSSTYPHVVFLNSFTIVNVIIVLLNGFYCVFLLHTLCLFLRKRKKKKERKVVSKVERVLCEAPYDMPEYSISINFT